MTYDPHHPITDTKLTKQELIDLVNWVHSKLYDLSYSPSFDPIAAETLHKIRYRIQVRVGV